MKTEITHKAIDIIMQFLATKRTYFSIRDIENLNEKYLGSTYTRELRRLRFIDVIYYEPTEYKGVYKLCSSQKQILKWLSERKAKDFAKN